MVYGRKMKKVREDRKHEININKAFGAFVTQYKLLNPLIKKNTSY